MFPRMVSRLPLIPLAVTVLVAGCDGRAPLGPEFLARTTAATSVSSTSAAALSESEIDVSWQDNSTNEAGFEVHRSTTGASGTFTLRATTGAGVTAFGDGGLSPSTEYCYKVRMFRTTGRKTSYSTFYNAACATTLAPPPPPIPSAPSDAEAIPVHSDAVFLGWGDNSSNEDGFRVERSVDGGASWEVAGTTRASMPGFSDLGRTSEQQVCYRVIAFVGQVDSSPSNTDCTTPPVAPTGLTATMVDQPAIDLSWTDNSAVEGGYEVWRTPDGATLELVVDLPANSTSYRDPDVTKSTWYSYQVRATKDGGGSFSDFAGAPGSCVPTGTTEICDNGVEDDCDGLTDDLDADCQLLSCGMGCPVGYVCGADGFCVPHCNDGYWNGDEGDVDCGGSCDVDCQTGQHCWLDGDCASGTCINSICQEPGGGP